MSNLRVEFADLVENIENIGHWILLRNFTDERSQYWNESFKEAVGGPAHKYNDVILKSYSTTAYSRLASRSEGIDIEQLGSISEDDMRYYFPHTVTINENDEIYELEYEGIDKPEVVFDSKLVNLEQKKVLVSTRYKVKKVQPYRFENAEIIYKVAFAYKSFAR